MKMYKSSVSKYDHGCSGNRYDYYRSGNNDYDNSLNNFTNNTCHRHSIVTSYQELQQELKLHRNSLAKAVKLLEAADLIKKDQIVIKSDDDYNSRADKSLWRISLVNTSRINNDNTLHEQKGQIGYDKQEERFDMTQSVINTYDQENNTGVKQALKPFIEKGCTEYDPPCTDSGQLFNKDFIINNSINKNIDYIDAKSRKEFLENEQSSFPSESYNNYSFLNDSCNNPKLRQTVKQEVTIIKPTHKAVLKEVIQKKEQKEEWRELRQFYPLSEKDVDMLNSRANREFSNNFVNQLLLKLYIKYPEKRFKNRFTFLSYMVQILANEKHQGPLVNHTTFRFRCNIDTTEKDLLEYERYLNQIEDSLDTNKEMQVRKKIAGRFNTEVAYKILTKVQFKINHDNSFITGLIPKRLALSERQIATFNEQLEAVYGVNGYYVQELDEKAIQPPKSRTPDIEFNNRSIGILESSNKPSAKSEEILEDTVWHQIRKSLREELGDHIDQVWFSKAAVVECSETSTLIITMPTKFMIDWVRNNYAHVIRRLINEYGIRILKFSNE